MISTDRNLLLRVARTLEDDAKCLLNSEGPNWSASPQARSAKREYDRLLRDARELREYVKRCTPRNTAATTGLNNG